MAKRSPTKKRSKRRTSRKAQPRASKRTRSASRSTANRDTRRLVLLVEDDAAARSGYAEFLADNGFRVVAVETASLALEHATKDVPDIVLTDIALPDLNGFELTRSLKRDRRLTAVQVIGLTGYWSSDASRDARGAGMAALLLKPVAPAHLIAEVTRVLAQR